MFGYGTFGQLTFAQSPQSNSTYFLALVAGVYTLAGAVVGLNRPPEFVVIAAIMSTYSSLGTSIVVSSGFSYSLIAGAVTYALMGIVPLFDRGVSGGLVVAAGIFAVTGKAVAFSFGVVAQAAVRQLKAFLYR